MERLKAVLSRIDGRGYKAYKEIAGRYDQGNLSLFIDHVQGDPFASPSKIRLRFHQAGFPSNLFHNRIRKIALQDFLTRRLAVRINSRPHQQMGSGKSGLIYVDVGGQEVLERTSMVVCSDWVEARIQVGLPARGRTVLGIQAFRLLCEDLPNLALKTLAWSATPKEEAIELINCIENQEFIRNQLNERGLMAFIANGAVLPRESGVSDLPLKKGALPFQSPPSLMVSFPLKNPLPQQSTVVGMGIPKGVNLIVGGGYHGKSTLLKALERCVYPHIPGDGREYVVSGANLVKIRAEDGRRAESVNITPFIDNLPFGRDTSSFTTDDASGSTSQASNILEAVEIGADGLLLDEDTSATNFMVRDARMQALVHKDHEPITPFLDRVGELYQQLNLSTIIVMGGCGDYFDVADRVIMMRDYKPFEVTEQARSISAQMGSIREREDKRPLGSMTVRVPLASSINASRGRRDVKIDSKSINTIIYGEELIDLSGVEQLLDPSQTRAIGYAIYLASQRFMNGKTGLRSVVEALDHFFNENGLDPLDPFYRDQHHPGNFARPRKFEIAAAINRLRSLRMKQLHSN